MSKPVPRTASVEAKVPSRREDTERAGERAPQAMTEKHRAAVDMGRVQIRRREVASDDEVEAVFHRFVS